MLADVQLKRTSRRRHRFDGFFYGFYLPLNFCMLYWPIPFIFPYLPDIKSEHLHRWKETNGPELWALFHVLMAALIGLIVYWSSRRCYRPSRFLWLPVVLGIISLFIYWS